MNSSTLALIKHIKAMSKIEASLQVYRESRSALAVIYSIKRAATLPSFRIGCSLSCGVFYPLLSC